ncbi:hypothetical protein O181_112875 [Austropuccinia psidii MF-1]|uniref:Uncharacterized protein n=1 Tax=Austropuccinia psidii MF-1 TaxID=1389203 RepID=A0A9Q3K5A2_9BASI|nr:hypothetical protein [Austropuccinia psidii MF-1]
MHIKILKLITIWGHNSIYDPLKVLKKQASTSPSALGRLLFLMVLDHPQWFQAILPKRPSFGLLDPLKIQKNWAQGDPNSPTRLWAMETKNGQKGTNVQEEKNDHN